MELAWLRTRLEAACNGYPHLVVLEGDPGIGKSRLALELIDEARRDEVSAYCGRCYENLALAYLPFQESLFAAVHAWAAMRGADDDVALLRHSLLGAAPADAAAEGPDEGERTRQMLGLTRVLLEFARTTPTIVFVDDLDWADEASIDLLRHVLFRFEDDPIPLLLVATSRADPTARAGAGVARLRAERRCAVLGLGPLPEVEATQIARQSGRDITVHDARRLAHAGGGNPLFIEALAREGSPNGATSSSAHGISDPLVTAIRARLVAMSGAARALLTTASIAPDLSPEEIATVSHLGPDEADRAKQEAIADGVIVDDADRVAFVHPLYEHVASRACEPSRRRAIHLEAATTLRARQDAGRPVSMRSIARHLQATRHDADPEVVAHYARLAGNEALAIGAWDEAADHYEAALAADPPESEPRARAALHRLAGLSRRANMELVEAVRHFDAAIELIGTDDENTLTELHMWRMRCGMATQQQAVDVARDRNTFERLVAAIETSNAPLAASSLVDIAQSYWIDGRMAESEAAGRRAMALAAECGNHDAQARAAMSLTVPLWFRYDLRESLALLHEGAHRWELAPDATTLVGGPEFRVPLVLAWLGRLDEAQERALECCARAEEVNYPLEEGLPLAALALVALVRGDFDGAQHFVHRAALVQQLSGYHWASGLFLPVSFAADLARGRLGSSLEALDTWAETADGLEQQTIAVYRRFTAAYERGFAVSGDPLPSLPHAPMIGADAWVAAEVEVARREESRVNVQRAFDLLSEMEHRGGVVVSGLGMLVARVRGIAAELLGDYDESIATLDRALEVCAELDAGPEHARTLADLARALMSRGDRKAAFARYGEAIEQFDRFGMVIEAEQTRRTVGDSSPTSRTRRTLPRPQTTTTTHTVVLFTDVVDSTRLTEDMGAVRYRTVARRLEDLIRSTFIANGGSVVSGINLGDGLIGLFASLEQGITAARRCAQEAPSTGLHLHLGIDLGQIVVDDQRIYGTPVNFAARLCSLTGPDEILVSDRVRNEAVDLAAIAFVDRGAHVLKGIDGEQRVHALVDSDQVQQLVG